MARRPDEPFRGWMEVAGGRTLVGRGSETVENTQQSAGGGLCETVHVALAERSYDIFIGAGQLATTAERMRALGTVSHAVVIADEAVAGYARQVQAACQSTMRADLLTVPSGEESKSIARVDQLWQDLLRLGADRKTCLVAVGGGVVGDLVGFVAATFTRGLRFCQIPTTLLSQVDSSVGGKTGVNLPQAKNMVGAFWQPSVVVIDTDTLHSLPEREYLSGMAEVIKYGMILDAELFERLERSVESLRRRDPDVLRSVIARCCELKAQVVAADERETTGLRAVLNYGHTFGHALEAVSGYGAMLHGEAVSIGMVCASRLAESLGRIDAELTQRQIRLLAAVGLPTKLPDLPHEKLWRAMQHDKKVEHGRLRFVLPTRMGHVELVPDIDASQVMAVLQVSH